MKRGFTLVELLAVLILLGIIGLVAIPAIGKVLDRSRKRALEGIKQELVKSAKKYTSENTSILPDPNNTSIMCLDIKTLLDKGYIEENNLVDPTTEQTLTGYIKIKYNSKYNQYQYSFNSSCLETKEYVNGTPIFFNPSTNTKCESSQSVSTTGTKTGCMRWYTFNDNIDDSNISLLLDHNLDINTAPWNANNVTNTGAVTALANLTSYTSSWNATVKSTVRLLNLDDIVKIIGNKTLNTSQAGEDDYFYFDTNTKNEPTNGYKYGWLYTKTKDDCEEYGCETNLEKGNDCWGYWINNPVYNTKKAWMVSRAGRIYYNQANYGSGGYGIRPVITINKNLLK